MKRLLLIKPALVIASLFMLSFLTLSIPALAGTTWVHGHSGHIEDTAKIKSGPFVKAQGLQFVPGSFNNYWIHFAIPMEQSPYTARYINLRFYTGVHSFVTQVDVYDAEKKVATLTVPGGTGWQDVSLDMGSQKTFNRGLGISVKAEGGPDAGVGKFTFSAVGASTDVPVGQPFTIWKKPWKKP
jgi:hypothetical protein